MVSVVNFGALTLWTARASKIEESFSYHQFHKIYQLRKSLKSSLTIKTFSNIFWIDKNSKLITYFDRSRNFFVESFSNFCYQFLHQQFSISVIPTLDEHHVSYRSRESLQRFFGFLMRHFPKKISRYNKRDICADHKPSYACISFHHF